MKRRMLAWLMVFVMLVSALPLTAMAAGGQGGGQGGNGQGGNGQGGNGQGGNQPSQATYNHIDVRVAGSLTIETKVNGVVTKQETVSVTVSNVSATLNGNALSFTEKEGEGDEHEWHCQGLSLDPTKDVVVVTCKISGTASDGSLINLTITKTYSGETTLKALIEECPADSGYDIDIETTDLTELFTVDVTVTKSWADDNNRDGIRPDSVQLQLYADGVAYGDPVTVNADSEWKASFENLPKYSSGETLVVYTVDEVAVPEGYTKSVNGYTVTNTHNPAQVTISGSKTWDDNNNQDGKRPDSITINLLADGTVVDSQPVTAGNGWKWEFTANKYRDQGEEIKYTVSEEAVTGYTATVDGTNVTNTHVPEKVTVSGSKTWNDENNQDGIRPGSITIRLYADGEEIKTATVTEADGWAWSFTDLDKYSNGKEIVYTITEDPVAGYETTVSGYNVTNTHSPAVTSVSGEKTWSDSNDQDGIRPESITINLLADGEKVASKTVTAADGWKWSFTDLPVYKAGAEIKYTITEDAVEGYESTVNDYNVTNTHTPAVTSVSGEKTWSDSNDQDGIRPESITIRVWNGETEVASKTVTADDGWAWSFTNLPKYAYGKEIKYTITEDAVEGYESAVSGYNVTNTHTPEKIDISGSKTWVDADNQDGKRPESITINLLANGEKVKSVIITEKEEWAWSFTGLDKYAGGKEIKYTITEETVDGYTTVVDGYNVTNTHAPETVEVSGAKTWNDNNDQDGKRPDSITIRLYADGKEIDDKTVTADDDWKWSFTNLPKYLKGEVGQAITYTITEDAVAEYTTEVNGYNVTNTHETETTSVSGSKTWEDNDNQDGKRPGSITIRLYADGEEVDSKTVTAADGWAWSFEDLNKYSNGEEIVYTITEDPVAEYEATVNGYDVTNTHTPETISVTVTKTWKDNKNQDGVRPESITVRLLANGKEVAFAEVTGDNWTHTFTDLPKYEAGEEIVYTIAEDTVEGYNTEIEGFSVINTHTPETIEISGTKTWVDADNQDGIRPESVTVRLYANDEEITYQTVGAEDDWTWKFINLPKFDAGEEIEYTITEDAVEGYTSTVNGYNVTNTHEVEKTEFTATKVWDDDDNRDGLRTEEVEVQLYANGEAYGKSVTLNEENQWTYTWTELDVNSAGTAIAYTVEEVKVPEGYGASVNGGTITNKHEVAKTSVSVTKVWDDAENQDGIRPATVQVQLYANGEVCGEAVTLNEEKWSHTWEDLKVNEAGKAIEYTVAEVAVPDGYDAQTTGDAENGYTITNSHTPEVTSVTVTKAWNDVDNQDGKRPTSVTVTLWADSVKTDKTVTLNKGNNWTATFEDLAKKSAGKDIVYTVEEVKIEPYTSVTTGDAENGYTITNIYTPESTSVQVKKAWDDKNDQDGIRPDSITVTLYADGEVADALGLNADNQWSGSFTGLDKYKDEGVEIVYTVEEESVDGYEASIAVDEDTGVITITNTHEVEKTQFTADKVWDDDDNRDGLRPESIDVQLYKNGEPYGDEVTLSEDNNWTNTWTDLDKNADGSAIAYTVGEVSEVDGYTTEVEGGTITNTHEIATVIVEGGKTWSDADDQDGKRPESITINLLADGVEIDSVIVTAEDDWAWSFTNLPKYADGVEIAYTITEDAVDGYTTVVDGYNVTNTHEVEKIEIPVTKVWNDADNQDGTRPAEITVALLADGEKTGEVLTLKEGAWSGSFTDLDKYADGQEIAYSVAEVEVPEGYTSTVSGDAENGFTITNTRDLKKTSVLVAKVWDDVLDQDGIRPDSITVKLLANGEDTGKTLTLSLANGWKGAFTDLDAYADGVAITYDVEEIQVEGYKVFEVWNEDGTAVTLINKHNVELTSVTVTKAWDDADDQDGIRPDSVAVQLMADGVVAGIPVILNAENQWTFTWEILPVNAAGKAITYTVEEITEIEGYTTEITGTAADGYTITNSHTPETTSLTAEKVWDDAENQDGKRPASVTVILLADGVETGASVKLNEENEWTASFTDLDKYAAGEEIVYTVAENKVEGYTASVAYEGDTAIVTNSYTPETTSIQVVKAWDDGNNKDGIRPEAVTVRLYANNQKTDMTLELSAEGKWTGAFENLPVYEDGETINYAVKEENVAEGYTVASIVVDPDTGIVKITNFHDTAVTEVSVYKEWDDGDDQDGIRPESVTIVLYADGEKVDSAELSEANNWKHTFADLALNNNGKEITYTVKEVKVEGYTVAYKATEDGWKVVNTHEPEIKEVTVSKVWYDNKDASDLRPDSITVQLYKNGKAWGDKFQLSDANNWKKTFELPVCEDGEEIQWTVKEVKVPEWYIVTYHQDSLTIMNTIQSDGSAKTGDVSNIWLWVGIMSVSAVAVVAVLVLSKKKKKA